MNNLTCSNCGYKKWMDETYDTNITWENCPNKCPGIKSKEKEYVQEENQKIV